MNDSAFGVVTAPCRTRSAWLWERSLKEAGRVS